MRYLPHTPEDIAEMLKAVGHRVLRLTRVREGCLRLGALGPGECRPLSSDELAGLQREVGLGVGEGGTKT